MRVISCQVKNFGSYKNLEFSFDEKGLCLIHGATGSGKSTLCDIISWVLFGQTAKGGSVNDVVAWGEDEPTFGNVLVELSAGHRIWVNRFRGKTAKDNDLFYVTPQLQQIRGKDLIDTQRLINAQLGIDVELYLSGAYFHEFSRTAAFFTATAKGRREICEQIVDLSLAEGLKTNLSIKSKSLEKELVEITKDLSTSRATEDVLMRMKAQAKKQYATWEKEQKARIDVLVDKALNFDEDNRQKLEIVRAEEKIWLNKALKESEQIKRGKCPTCGGDWHQHTSSVDMRTSPYARQIKQLSEATNTYEEQLRELVDQVNPHRDTEAKASEELFAVKKRIEALTVIGDEKQEQVSDIETLTATVADFRGALVTRTIKELQTTTNDYITKYFDAEIRVTFSVESADRVDTLIHKDGNECVYTQLSKGQRQLLKLCFGLAVMRAVTNHHGVKFNSIFLDEAFDGLDDRFKVKAFTLLETLSLEYESVFVVEHSSELKNLFANQYEVELVNGNSVIHAQPV